MDGPLQHFLVILPLFGVILIVIILPLLQWVSTRLLDRRFVLRLGGPWKVGNRDHRWDVLFSVIAFTLALGASFLILETLISKGILPPVR